jgi:hypothetical protein
MRHIVNALIRSSTLPLTAVAPATLGSGLAIDRRRMKDAASAQPLPSLRVISAWLFAGFFGMSLAASAIASVFDAGEGAGVGTAVRIVAGAAFAWIASRCLATFARDAERLDSDTSEFEQETSGSA